MPYAVQPLVDRWVILIRLIGNLSLPEIRAGGQRVEALVAAGEAPVHVIVDITQLGDYPLSPSALFEASPYLRQANLGEVPVFGVNGLLLNTLLRVFGQMAPFRYRVVRSLPESMSYLGSQDSRLDRDSVAEALRRAGEMLGS